MKLLLIALVMLLFGCDLCPQGVPDYVDYVESYTRTMKLCHNPQAPCWHSRLAHMEDPPEFKWVSRAVLWEAVCGHQWNAHSD